MTMNNQIPRIKDGLHFRTKRKVCWNIPQESGPRVEWCVPEGTRGVVRVNPSNYEVGFAFAGLSHPLYGVAPTIRKPGAALQDWAEEIDPMKGTP
jgi:hypothetical protein